MIFWNIADFDTIFVTGPHRSGTTICSKMIAYDTGHDLVIEDDFDCSNLIQLSAFLQADYGPKVIQCPFLSAVIHDMNYLLDVDMSKVLVVFMHRYRPDIIASEQRATKVDFGRVAAGQKVAYHSNKVRHISDVKYEAWEDQRKVIPNYLDVGYESLKQHPLWVEDRTSMPFQHTIRKPQISRIYADGIRTLSNI